MDLILFKSATSKASYRRAVSRVTKWVCIYRPGSVYRPFWIFGSVKGLYFMKKVCILTKMEEVTIKLL